MRTLFKNGSIYKENFEIHRYMSVKDGIIDYIGDYEPIGVKFDKKIDLHGSFIIPGFFDSHIHLLSYSKTLFELNLAGIESVSKLEEVLKNFKSKENIIHGFGWDDEKWEKKPDRKILDKFFPDRLVVLKRRDGHSLWVNSLVLKKLGIDDSTPDPEGGKIERDEYGNPNGILRDRAMELVRLPELIDDKRRILGRGIEKLYSLGITSLCNMDGEILPILIEEGFKIRIFNSIPFEKLDSILDIGLKSFFGNDFLKIGGVKVFLDGSLGSKTCFMKEGFEYEKDNKGLIYFKKSELEEIFKRIEENGLTLWIHAIGDMANEIILSVLEKFWINRNLTHRVEHAQILSESLIEKIKKIRPFLSLQPSHIYLDIDKIERFLGERGRWTYPIRSLIETGSVVSFGSDAPIENPDPMRGIRISVDRKIDGRPFYSEERIDIKEAFKAYTINGARSVKEDKRIGSIKEGKFADFVVFDDDPLLLKGKLISTYVNGMRVYGLEKFS